MTGREVSKSGKRRGGGRGDAVSELDMRGAKDHVSAKCLTLVPRWVSAFTRACVPAP